MMIFFSLFLGFVLGGLKRKKSNKKFCESLSGRHNVPRDILGGHHQIYMDYFADDFVYKEKHFRRRFLISGSMFFRIVTAVESYDAYFRQMPNAARFLGASPI